MKFSFAEEILLELESLILDFDVLLVLAAKEREKARKVLEQQRGIWSQLAESSGEDRKGLLKELKRLREKEKEHLSRAALFEAMFHDPRFIRFRLLAKIQELWDRMRGEADEASESFRSSSFFGVA